MAEVTATAKHQRDQDVTIISRRKEGSPPNIRWRFEGIVNGRKVGVIANAIDVETRSEQDVREWIQRGLVSAAKNLDNAE